MKSLRTLLTLAVKIPPEKRDQTISALREVLNHQDIVLKRPEDMSVDQRLSDAPAYLRNEKYKNKVKDGCLP